MKRHVLIILPAMGIGLAGCTLTGLVGSSDRLSCPLSEGVTCKPMSQVYEESVQGRQADKHHEEAATDTGGPAPKRADARQSYRLTSSVASPENEPVPLRTRPNTQRIWIAPWQDADGDLHEDAWIVVRLDDGEWMLEHVRDRVRAGFSTALKAPPMAAAEAGREEEPASTAAIPSLPSPAPARGPAAAGKPFVPTR